MALSILVLNGPNLNMLGSRELEFYGSKSLDEINADLKEQARQLDVVLGFLQSNHEGILIDAVQVAKEKYDGILLNAGGLTHTSIALRDAFLAVKIPFVEVHLSNIYAREPFRQRSYFSDIAIGLVQGFGDRSYFLALNGLVQHLRQR